MQLNRVGDRTRSNNNQPIMYILVKEEKLHFLALFSLEEMPVFPLNEYNS
jgi:hypothetical protein